MYYQSTNQNLASEASNLQFENYYQVNLYQFYLPKCMLVFGLMALDNGVLEKIDDFQIISITRDTKLFQ